MSTVKSTFDGFVGTPSGPVLLHEGDEHPADSALVKDRPDLFTKPVEESKRPTFSGKKGSDS